MGEVIHTLESRLRSLGGVGGGGVRQRPRQKRRELAAELRLGELQGLEDVRFAWRLGGSGFGWEERRKNSVISGWATPFGEACASPRIT